jgi:glycosyltransferase involved in cell wall biosynthesis
MSSTRRIGYLIPEFPGQTHNFFWREYQGLVARGIEPDLVSTRKPPRGIVAHAWSEDAMARTVYLYPPNAEIVGRACVEIMRANPLGWSRCLASIARAEGLDLKGRARLFALAALGAELAALARKRQWKHVHVHSFGDASHIAMFARLLTGLSYSVTLHGPLHEYGPNQREKWRHASFAILISRVLDQFVREALKGALPPVLALAPMGVDIKRFTRTRAYTPWNPGERLRIFCTGRLNYGKGHEFLIEAVQKVVALGIDAHLEIAGEDELGGRGYRKAIETFIAEHGMAQHTTLLGAVDEDVVIDHLQRAHIFAIGSLREGVPVAVMEAMALELPVVVTSVGGVTELVDDSVNGWVVPAKDSDRLAAAIARLARNPDEAVAFGKAARHTVETNFHSGRSVDVLDRHMPA